MEQLKKLFPGTVSPIMRENASLAEAPGYGKKVTLYAPKSHGADDYRHVSSWLSNKLTRN